MDTLVRERVRAPAVAGRFYPGRGNELAAAVDGYLADAAARSGLRPAAGEPPPKILLVPHAGYMYSGPVAASAYVRLRPWRTQVRRVVLLGPTHRVAVRALAAPHADAFATPLGTVPVDHEALAAIAALPQVLASDAVHAEEHALEVQLPFLQRVLGAFSIVPLAVGQVAPDAVAEVLERLWGGAETLIVISSDLSHYLPYAHAQACDRATMDKVLRLEPSIDSHQACGAAALAGALIAARRHGLTPRLLDLRNSGDTAGDRQRVVGYGAVAFDVPAAAAPSIDGSDEDVTESGRTAGGDPVGASAPGASADPPAASARPRTGDAAPVAIEAPHDPIGPALLAHARHAIAAALGLPADAAPTHPELEAPGATFVTLRRHGALRGCIGALRAERPLHEDVRRHALAAAFDDPRFAPLVREEFDALRIEVSVLDDPEQIEVRSEREARRLLRRGEDGVILEWRGRRATFLPQVWDQLPQPASFLRALKLKAGLPPDFWAADVSLARYRVRKFVEEAA